MTPLELTAEQRARLDRLRKHFGIEYVVRLRNAADTAARREFDRVLECNMYRAEAELSTAIVPSATRAVADTIPPKGDTIPAPPIGGVL